MLTVLPVSVLHIGVRTTFGLIGTVVVAVVADWLPEDHLAWFVLELSMSSICPSSWLAIGSMGGVVRRITRR